MFQLMKLPSRQSNILDLLITNNPEMVTEIQAGPSMTDVGLPSDHYPFTFDITISNRLSSKTLCLRF